MAIYTVEPDVRNLHGIFSCDIEPILTVESGDTVIYNKIPDAAWNSRPRRFEGDEPERIPRDPQVNPGHCLVGPIFVKDAEPGDVLEVQIVELIPGQYGWTSSAGWNHEVHRRFGLTDPPEATLFWELFPDRMVGRDQAGRQVKLNPFLGVMGMPVAQPGLQPTPPPRRTGGNLDCKELVAGASLFLPIEVAGGLFSTGDGHAAQGDGEVCVTAIEFPMDRAELRFVLHKDLAYKMPRARNEDSWITLGMNEDLDEAVFLALGEMLDLIEAKYEVDRKTALALASVVVDIRVTQIVNGVKGAHAILRNDAIKL